MTTTLRVIIALAIWGIYSLVAYHGCIKPSCCGDAGEEVSDELTFDVQQLGPVISNWNLPNVETNEGYDTWRQNLLAQFKDKGDGILEIYGSYYESEPKPEGFANMGFARAESIKALLVPDIPADQIRTRARAVLDEPEGIRERPFDALAELKWIEPEREQAPDQSVTVITDEKTGQVDRVVLLFALNATIQEDNPEIMAELEKMAKNIIETKQRVSVVGHADNTGTDEHNFELGMSRANTIKNVLEKLGVSAAQIQATSKGETEPTDTNDTEVGRHNNRRVEVRVIK